MERDQAWLESERQRLMTWPREKLIGWLQWNDPNGVWSDEDMLADDMDPMTVEDAVEQVMMFVEETGESPEEMMQGSLSANPGRYPKPAEFDPWLKNTPMPPLPPKALDVKWLMRKDPDAFDSLIEMMGSEADELELEDAPDGYLARHPRTGEVWEYDGANGFWVEA